MFGRWRDRRRRRARARRGGPDGCECADVCGEPFGCDLSLMVLVASLVRASAVRPGRPRPAPSRPARVGIAAIRGYQRWLSPRLPVTCRYTPSCSAYGVQAAARHGLAVGTRLTAGRIARCTRAVPLGTADPVP